MTDEPKNDPRSRMRTLLGSSSESGDLAGEMKMPEMKSSPLTKLPKKMESASMPKDQDLTVPPVSQEPPPPTKARPASDSPALSGEAPKRRRLSLGPPFWTLTGILSLTINIILIVILISLYLNLQNLNLGGVVNLPSGLLGGLYTNFEKMDRAHIRTNVVVNTTIPVKFDLALNQQTNVVLSQDVQISNARVTVSSGGLSIENALANIVLPAGTNLPVVLNLTVPVDQNVPVTLNVPVDIALNQTDLHEPFVGLQQVIHPLYCMAVPSAVNLDGQVICNPTQ